MTPEQFCYWLQGFCELFPSQDKEWSKNWTPDIYQWNLIMLHLNTVMSKVTSQSVKFDKSTLVC